MPRPFILQKIDPATGSPVAEARVLVDNVASLCEAIGVKDDPDLAATYDLDPEDVARIGALYGAALDPGLHVLEPWHRLREIPYLVHTGYELPLMLEGRKPLSVFGDLWPAEWLSEMMMRFAPFIKAGQIIEYIEDRPPPSEKLRAAGDTSVRQVLYALPGEEWRITAYLELWRELENSHWSADMERRQGELLGYELWQMDWWMERWTPPPKLPERR